MAVWSKVLPLTASCLPPVVWEKALVFAGLSGFVYQSQQVL